MGKVTGFKEFERKDESYTKVEERVQHYNEFTVPLSILENIPHPITPKSTYIG